MIKYQLICDQNHEFEGWFQGSAAYDEQAANGLLCCPLCDSDQVKRALMTPNLASPKRRKSAVPSTSDQLPATEPAASVPSSPLSAPSASSRIGHPAPPDQGRVIQAEQVQAFGAALAELRTLRQKITRECRDVGDNFAAGMTGGMAFIYDKSKEFDKKVNPDSVIWQKVETEYWYKFLKQLLKEHFEETGSRLSKKIIDNFAEEIQNFVQVCPKEMIDKLENPVSLKSKVEKVS